jgi:hypothetical protein
MSLSMLFLVDVIVVVVIVVVIAVDVCFVPCTLPIDFTSWCTRPSPLNTATRKHARRNDTTNDSVARENSKEILLDAARHIFIDPNHHASSCIIISFYIYIYRIDISIYLCIV